MCLCLTELFQIELFFDIKTVFTLNWIITYNCLNSLKWKCFWQLNCVHKFNCQKLFSIEQIIYIKMDLALNNLQRLICHKTNKPTNQQNSRCSLYIDRDETINNIISECRILVQKVTGHDWVGKVIHRELCKKMIYWGLWTNGICITQNPS